MHFSRAQHMRVIDVHVGWSAHVLVKPAFPNLSTNKPAYH